MSTRSQWKSRIVVFACPSYARTNMAFKKNICIECHSLQSGQSSGIMRIEKDSRHSLGHPQFNLFPKT